MEDWLLGLPVVWLAAVLLVATYLVTAGIYLVITRLASGARARAFKAISPGVLPPLAVVFGLLVGFLAAQVWNDADRATVAVNREASSLRAVVLLAAAFPGDTETKLRELIRRHIDEAARQEWPAMAHARVTLALVPRYLNQALLLALRLTPHGEGQAAAQRELIASLQTALDARRQRIILSHSSLNWVKWAVLLVEGALFMITVALVHSDNPAANRIILSIFAVGIGAALVLIASHMRPFTGEISVQPTVLLRVMPEAVSPGTR